MPPTAPLVARDLRKRYGDTHALDGFDLEVAAGTVHGLLGPNGAGKSTAVRSLATLTRYDSGEASVAGHDVGRNPRAVRRAVGLVGQAAAVDEVLHGLDNLVLFARLHGLFAPAARARADELLERFGLTEAATKPVSTYSGGMRRRLDIAAGLVLRPSVLFLDEPTTGLDPRGRNEVWEMVRGVVALGTTVLLTTQYLDEADQLADRITVMGAGRVIAEGTSTELKSRLGGDRVIVRLAADADSGAAREALGGEYDAATRHLAIEAGAAGGSAALVHAVRTLDGAGVAFDDVLLRRPTLNEVFLHLTSNPAPEGAAR